MKRIMLVCAQGMSTSLLVEKMKAYAASQGIEAKIWAIGNGQILENYKDADVILLGPQIRYRKKAVIEQINNFCPVGLIDMIDYGTMNGENVFNKALELINGTTNN